MHWKVQALVNNGCASLEKENFAQAITCFEKAIELSPDMSELYAYLGEACYWNREYDRALDAFKRRDELVLQADPLTPYIEGYRGCIFRQKENDPEASLLLKKAVSQNVKDPEIHYQLGILYMREGKFPEALKIFKQMDRLEPSFYYRKIRRLMEELRAFQIRSI